MATQSGKSWRRAGLAPVVTVVALVALGWLLASGAAAAGLATESPRQVMSATVAALKSAKSFEMHADYHGGGTNTVETLIASGQNRVSLSVRQNGQAFKVIVVGKTVYLRGTPSYWVAQGSTKSLAKLLAPRWYRIPAKELSGLSGGEGKVSSSALTKCLAQDTKQMTNSGSTTVDGQPAVLLKSPGTAPGTHPETIAVAATGAPYLLRVAVTGSATPGPIGACNSPQSAKQTGTLTTSHWNSAPEVNAPAHAVSLRGMDAI